MFRFGILRCCSTTHPSQHPLPFPVVVVIVTVQTLTLLLPVHEPHLEDPTHLAPLLLSHLATQVYLLDVLVVADLREDGSEMAAVRDVGVAEGEVEEVGPVALPQEGNAGEAVVVWVGIRYLPAVPPAVGRAGTGAVRVRR